MTDRQSHSPRIAVLVACFNRHRITLPNMAALIAALFVGVRLRRVRQSRRLSLALAMSSVLYLGFYANNSFTYVTFLQPFLGTGWSYLLGAYATMVLASAIWEFAPSIW